MDIQGVWVHFHIRDVYVPEPRDLLHMLHGDKELHGKVVAVSDSGVPRGLYGVVEVEGIDQPLIVPASLLKITHAIE